MTRLVYALVSSALATLGVVHMAATTRYYAHHVASEALWFFSGGLLMVLAAARNFLNRAYGHLAPGLRWVCVGTNVVITGFALPSGLAGHAKAGQWAIVLGILVPLSYSRCPDACCAPRQIPVRPNQTMKPAALRRNNSSVFATTPCRGLSLSR